MTLAFQEHNNLTLFTYTNKVDLCKEEYEKRFKSGKRKEKYYSLRLKKSKSKNMVKNLWRKFFQREYFPFIWIFSSLSQIFILEEKNQNQKNRKKGKNKSEHYSKSFNYKALFIHNLFESCWHLWIRIHSTVLCTAILAVVNPHCFLQTNNCSLCSGRWCSFRRIASLRLQWLESFDGFTRLEQIL